jgi:hypothetical protein
MGGLSGQATDIDIHAREILRMRDITNQLLAKHSGQKLDRVEKDVERDFIMNSQQAKDYGIIDDIIYKTREGYDRRFAGQNSRRSRRKTIKSVPQGQTARGYRQDHAE